MNKRKGRKAFMGRGMAYLMSLILVLGSVGFSDGMYVQAGNLADTTVPGTDVPEGDRPADEAEGTIPSEGGGSGEGDTQTSPSEGDGLGEGNTETGPSEGNGSGEGSTETGPSEGNGSGEGNTGTGPSEGNGSGEGDTGTSPSEGDEPEEGDKVTESPEEEELDPEEEIPQEDALLSEKKERLVGIGSGNWGGYETFVTDEVLYNLAFGTDVTQADIYQNPDADTLAVGFRDVEYKNPAEGVVGNVFRPRKVSRDEPGSSYVENGTGYLAIASQVWTEANTLSGYAFTNTYENTSSFDMQLPGADYRVEVTLVNPSSAAYVADMKAEDITRISGIQVAPGATQTVSFDVCLVDEVLSLKFLAQNSAASMEAAALQKVYVSGIKVTRLATNERGGKPTVYLASDSTVQTYEDYYDPQTGWGETLAMFFGGEVIESAATDCGYSQARRYEAANAVVENRAIGGRSSKSFVVEGKLDDLLEDIRPGDYLFVQWGHNDSTYSRPERYVDPTPEEFGRWIQYYVDGALQRGATPVLVTPVARYSYTTLDDGTVSFVGNFEQYGNICRSMAAAQNIPLIDLTARSVAVCNSFGVEGAKSLFLHVAAGEYTGAYAGGVSDSTHLQWYGAYKFAQCVADGILESDNQALADLKARVVPRTAMDVPARIGNLKVGTVGSKSVNISWDGDPNAEMYYVYRQKLADGQSIADVNFDGAEKYSATSGTRFADAGCEAGCTYVYAVAGYNDKGVGELSEYAQAKTKSAGYQFDFNGRKSDNGPTMEGWVGVTAEQAYDQTAGYGWIKAPGNGRYRKNNGMGTSSDMADDFTLGAGEFAVDLPNGDYEVTIYAGDLLAGTSTIKNSYTAEGAGIGSISTKQALASCTATVRVEDGQLNVTTDNYLNGMTITELLLAPSGLTYSELSMDEAVGAATFLLGFTPSDGGMSYNIYRKGSADTRFSQVKSFTKEEYEELGITVCCAMTGDIGEVYEYYMTCVDQEGKESARSNIITVELFVEGDPAPAPQNLICTSPTQDATELQRYISLQWDALDGAIKYYIYRSDKAEDEKGFTGFVKVGECGRGTTVYTDHDVATNMHYYYKVAALTKTGVGEMSEACQTPVTGSLVHGGTEKYASRALVAIDLSGRDGGETLVSAKGPDGTTYTKGVYLSWRSFEGDCNGAGQLATTFTVYKNGNVLAKDLTVTNLIDPEGSAADIYKVVGSGDGKLGLVAKDVKPWTDKYLELSLFAPEDETMPDGTACTYSANDMSVGDLDGDGELELVVKWYPGNAKDNSGSGYTGKTFLDGYDIDFSTGTVKLLWRIDMGVNIRSGAHYTQFQVWDYDGDGRAEIAVKTADGTTTYRNTVAGGIGLEETGYVGACNASALPVETISARNDYRNSSGYVLDGPEYFTIFNGEDGTIADTVDYIPERGSVSAWGDGYGNRVDRFLSATAYLDGETPFAVFCRGYYTRTCLTAYGMKDTNEDGIGDEIFTYWTFDTKEAGSQYEAQGNHGLSVNDIDGDGKDEIIYGALAIDHDGTVKWCTGNGHGDAMHVSDWVPWNPGLEILQVHEHNDAKYHVEILDAETGETLMGYYTGRDTGRGVAADIDPTSPGGEWWSVAGPNWTPSGDESEPSWDSTRGNVFSALSTLDNLVKLADATPASNFTIFWDGDLLSEIQDHEFNEKNGYVPIGVTISKWNYETQTQEPLLYSEEIWSSNGTKGNLGLVADILGDWREEIIARCSGDKNKIRIYSTTIETDYVVPCLLQDLAYREGVAWQNVGYNQPANLSYLLSQGLLTAQLDNGKAGQDYVQFDFTEANDGIYGNEILGYKVYRAEGDGEFELHDTYILPGKDGSEGRDSFFSRILAATTTVKIAQKPEIAVESIRLVEGMPIPEGKTLESLFPAYVEVVDADGKTQKAPVTWDVTEVNLEKAGTYPVKAQVSGWDELLEVQVTVAANQISGFVPVEDIVLVQDPDFDKVAFEKQLPRTVKVSYTNTTTEEVAVTWDYSDVDFAVAGVYTVKGTLATEVGGLEESPVIRVEIKADYVESVDMVYAEIEWNTENVAGAMPVKVQVKWASGKTGREPVEWTDVTGVKADTVGTYTATGKVEGYQGEVKASVYVAYPAVYRFDFGIDAKKVPGTDGWIGMTVNAKGKTAKLSALGSFYTKEQGYGFETDSTMQGRTEVISQPGLYPNEVTDDFALPDGNTFLVDVPDGTYYVEIISNSALKSNVKSVVEGTALNVDSAAGEVNTGGCQAEVMDGQLTIQFTGNNSRVGGIIVRQVSLSDRKAVGIKELDMVEVSFGTALQDVELPEEVTVVYDDGLERSVAVVWDLDGNTAYKPNVPGVYTITGKLAKQIEGFQTKPTIAVKVKDHDADAKVLGFAAMDPVEVLVGTSDVELPGTVTVVYEDGFTWDVEVEWDAVDASTIGIQKVKGTLKTSVEGLDVMPEIEVVAVYRFDFGAGSVENGWIQVKSSSDTYETNGAYGFTEESKALGYSDKSYKDPDAVYADCVLGWNAEKAYEYIVKVPNGRYEVTVYSYNGSGSQYNHYEAEGVAIGADIRLGNSSQTKNQNVVTVDVADGELNVTNRSCKAGQPAIYFNGLVIRPVAPASSGNSIMANLRRAVSEISGLQLLDETVSGTGAFEQMEGGYRYTDTKDVKSNTTYRYKVQAIVKDTPVVAASDTPDTPDVPDTPDTPGTPNVPGTSGGSQNAGNESAGGSGAGGDGTTEGTGASGTGTSVAVNGTGNRPGSTANGQTVQGDGQGTSTDDADAGTETPGTKDADAVPEEDTGESADAAEDSDLTDLGTDDDVPLAAPEAGTAFPIWSVLLTGLAVILAGTIFLLVLYKRRKAQEEE